MGFGLTENSYRQLGGGVVPLTEKEMEGIKPYVVALQNEEWLVNNDFSIDTHREDGPLWRYRLDISNMDDSEVVRFRIEVFKRPHSRGFFKTKAAYSAEVATEEDGEWVSKGFIVNTNHMEALRSALRGYLGQDDLYETELDALEANGADLELVMAR